VTIRHPSAFSRARPAGFDGVFDWDFLVPAFRGTRITPMDIDAIIERNGQFLIIETKSPGKTVPVGQQITFRALMALGCFHIFFVIGKTDDEIEGLAEWHPGRIDPPEPLPADAARVVRRVAAWFAWADGRMPRKEAT
jgi:hypothetical protein